MPDTPGLVLLRSGTVASGQYLFIDLSTDPPTMVSADQILPQALLTKLTEIDAKLGEIMSDQAAEQQQLNDLASAIGAVSDHVSAASATLSQWMAQVQAQPAAAALDFSGAQTALASLQAADATLGGVAGQVPSQPLAAPVADPGPAPAAPVDTTGAAPVDTSGSTPSG